jgi:hypothetical protein
MDLNGVVDEMVDVSHSKNPDYETFIHDSLLSITIDSLQ